MKHTPGPWHVVPETLGAVEAANGTQVALAQQTEPVRDASSYNERHANARLIAAAPDLLQALQFLHDDNADYLTRNKLGGMDNHGMKLARAAIAKATEAANA